MGETARAPKPSDSDMPPPSQLTVTFEVVGEGMGDCRARLSGLEGSELVTKYGGVGRALAASRETIVWTLDVLIEEFYDEV